MDVLASRHVVDFVIAVMLIEALVLILRRRDATTDIMLALLPGLCLLLALRVAGGSGPIVVALLTASLPFHLIDLHRRGLLARGGATDNLRRRWP